MLVAACVCVCQAVSDVRGNKAPVSTRSNDILRLCPLPPNHNLKGQLRHTLFSCGRIAVASQSTSEGGGLGVVETNFHTASYLLLPDIGCKRNDLTVIYRAISVGMLTVENGGETARLSICKITVESFPRASPFARGRRILT